MDAPVIVTLVLGGVVLLAGVQADSAGLAAFGLAIVTFDVWRLRRQKKRREALKRAEELNAVVAG